MNKPPHTAAEQTSPDFWEDVFTMFLPKDLSNLVQTSETSDNKVVETTGKLTTYMYGYPTELDKEPPEKRPDGQTIPYGFQMSVYQQDPTKNIQLSEMLGIEMWLSILNMSGANTNYIDKMYMDPKHKPFVNEISFTQRQKNMLATPTPSA